jgi:hypothetical protein
MRPPRGAARTRAFDLRRRHAARIPGPALLACPGARRPRCAPLNLALAAPWSRLAPPGPIRFGIPSLATFRHSYPRSDGARARPASAHQALPAHHESVGGLLHAASPSAHALHALSPPPGYFIQGKSNAHRARPAVHAASNPLHHTRGPASRARLALGFFAVSLFGPPVGAVWAPSSLLADGSPRFDSPLPLL